VRDLYVEGRQVVRRGILKTVEMPEIIEKQDQMARALMG
jgi:hypothetical protein